MRVMETMPTGEMADEILAGGPLDRAKRKPFGIDGFASGEISSDIRVTYKRMRGNAC